MSEYSVENNRNYSLGETPSSEESSTINMNYNPYQSYKIEEDSKKEEFAKKVKEEI